MIGVIARKNEARIVEEFFQLFKTPWEYYLPEKPYDVVLATEDVRQIEAKILVMYNSKNSQFDSMHGIITRSQDKKVPLKYKYFEYPIYGNLVTFISSHPPLIQAKNGSGVAGLKINVHEQQIIRIGYNLFEEVAFLLSEGQPKENAIIPTLEFHIAMLLDWILQAGMPLVEIPPIPADQKFFVCLTHDIDFAGMRRHKFDHTMLGFLYRALVGSILTIGKRRLGWRRLLRNWWAVLSLSGVYLGLLKDFWVQFEKYFEIESSLGSTFFFIPFKNNPGKRHLITAPKRRAARYDVGDIPDLVKTVSNQGCEIGLHGIDAWHDSSKGREEMNRVREAAACSEIGVRMHWLYFDEHSPKVLEKTGFVYDSSFGYNDAVGHRAGTAQVFNPPGTQTLLELPLHIMDTALFFRKRMNLSDSRASALCDKLIQDALKFGGCLTINWHDRSLAPERLWGEFYTNLLNGLKACGPCFMTAMQIVKWFQKRREVRFEEIHFTKSGLRLKFKQMDFDSDPRLTLRIYPPSERDSTNQDFASTTRSYFDVKLSHDREMQIAF